MKEKELTEKTLKIRELNDQFRKCPCHRKFGKLVITRGLIESVEMKDQASLMYLVCNFDKFTKGNDPYGEHDCAIFSFKGEKLMFKIDYYDKNLEFQSEDPSDPNKTIRVLTIMRADEY